jgi:radical SAM protein with 4Fe4S-binding SPASM domain
LISVSRLLRGRPETGDHVRYSGRSSPYPLVLVFNVTRNCNLRCVHCYSNSGTRSYQDLPLDTWLRAVRQAADMGVKHILLSGGEPLMRRDLHLIAKEAHDYGIRVELSTNGTMITEERISELKNYIDYVGVSLDGPKEIHDKVRGVEGAFERALEGLKVAKKFGLKTGLRMTLTRLNYAHVDEVFRIMKENDIDRICFYHLAYAGRADAGLDIPNSERLKVIEKIADYAKNTDFEVLTADNPVDGILLYKMTRSPTVYELLKRNGGNKSGERIADVSPEGIIYPDQFTPIPIGVIENLKEPWDKPHPLVAKLRDRKKYVKCSSCPFFEVCNGGLRARAYAVTGDFWERDPSCYLDEIQKKYDNDNSR